MRLRLAFFSVPFMCCTSIYSQDKIVRSVSGNMGIKLLVVENDTFSISYRNDLYRGVDSARKETKENELTLQTQIHATNEQGEGFKIIRDTIARMHLSNAEEWNKFFSKTVLFQIMPYIPPHRMMGKQISVKLSTSKTTVLINIISKDDLELNLMLDYLSNEVFYGKRKDIFEKIKSMKR